MVEDTSEPEHVAGLIGSASGQPFRARVPIVHSATGAAPGRPTEVEADQLDDRAAALILRHEKVPGRDVAVNDADPMRRLQAGGGLQADIHRLPKRQRTAGGEYVEQELAREKFSDGVCEPVRGFAHLHEPRDVRMTYLTGSPKPKYKLW